MRHERDEDGWPVVSSGETLGELIASALVLVFALLGIVLTYGAAVMYP